MKGPAKSSRSLAELSAFPFLLALRHFHRRRSHFPDSLAILTNRTVRRKLAHAGNIQNRLASPCSGISPENTDRILAIDIGLIVSEQQERVLPEEVLY